MSTDQYSVMILFYYFNIGISLKDLISVRLYFFNHCMFKFTYQAVLSSPASIRLMSEQS